MLVFSMFLWLRSLEKIYIPTLATVAVPQHVCVSLSCVGATRHAAWISCQAEEANQTSPKTLFYFWIVWRLRWLPDCDTDAALKPSHALCCFEHLEEEFIGCDLSRYFNFWISISVRYFFSRYGQHILRHTHTAVKACSLIYYYFIFRFVPSCSLHGCWLFIGCFCSMEAPFNMYKLVEAIIAALMV